jgi:hypothetical protein
MAYYGGTITPSNTPRPEHEDGHHEFTHRLGHNERFLPLQEPELLLSRNHLSSLLLHAANNNENPHRHHSRRASTTAFNNPHMRYMRLIGDNNPRYQWEQYRKTPEELKGMKKPTSVPCH